jgi:transcription elongation factor GreA
MQKTITQTGAEESQVKLTKEGFDELKTELTELVEIKLPEVIKRVATARDHGDLSENAEYHSARDDQQLLQARIDEIQDILDNAVVIKNTTSHTKIGMGSRVEIVKAGTKKSREVMIVGEFEADPTAGKVSSGSPLGKALMGKKNGDKAIVQAPAGDIEYEINKIK